MLLSFRVILLLSFALYWGGLTFYTGFVVRISHDVLSDPMDGGLITQRVTMLLQLLGAWTATLMLFNGFHVRRAAKPIGTCLAVCAIVLALSIVGLFIVHGQLDVVIDIDAGEITDREAFTAGHQRYNQLTTIQWIAALVYLPLTVLAWKHVDQKVLE